MKVDLSAWMQRAKQRTEELLEHDGTTSLKSPPHPNGGYVLDVDGERALGQFIVWPNGATEATVMDVSTGRQVYFEGGAAETIEDLELSFQKFLVATQTRSPPRP